MAYTKTPMQSTEQTKTVPLMYEYETRSRDALKDTDALNILWEPVINQAAGEQYFNALKRDGSSLWFATPDGNTTLGLFYWDLFQGLIVQATSANIYVRAADTGIIVGTTAYISGSATLTFGATEFLFQDGSRAFLLYDGTTMIKIASTFVFTFYTNPATPNFPTSGVPINPIALDGYVFIGSPDGTISNSNLNDPGTWSASNFTKADSYPDNLAALARVGPYLVALGRQSIQYYYDAGNPTGTPLGAMTGSTLTVGFVAALAQQEGVLWFIGRSSDGFYRVYKLENFKATAVSDPVINRWLADLFNSSSSLGTQVKGNMVNMNGHQLYMLSDTTQTASPKTYAYDIETQMWSRIDVNNGNSVKYSATGNASTSSLLFSKERTFFAVGPNNASGPALDTNIYFFDPTAYQDNGVNFLVSFRTPQQDFGTYRNKFGERLLLWADKASSTTLCSISWTDDDYQTYSTVRTVDLSSDYPVLYALGKFKRRSFRVQYSDNFPMRWKLLELDYDQGTS